MKNHKNSVRAFYLKFCIFLINFLEWIINNKKIIPFYAFICKLRYLDFLNTIIIQIFPIVFSLIYAIYKICINSFKNMKIAFIADGNRRYLKKNNKDEEQVKKDGLKKMWEVIKFCSFCNLSEVGFYCFSIKNFNRSDKEIQNVLQLLTNDIKPVNYKIKVIGNMTLLPDNVKINLHKLVDKTKYNKGLIVNLFIAYSTQDDIENGVKFNNTVDLVVRTSGEKRLSDFLILQCCNGTNIFFCDFLWPEITSVHVFLILLKYKLEHLFFN